MKTLLKLTFIALLLGALSPAYSQYDIIFEYDATGNRIRRYVPDDGGGRVAEEQAAPPAAADETPLARGSVYPNPTGGILRFSIETPESVPSQVTLYDLNGTLIYQKTFDTAPFDIDIADSRPGVYLLRWRFADQVRQLKIIKH